MNKIEKTLKEKKDILSVYFTAGYPDTDDTMTIMKALQEGGADLIEVGIPFSDPVADGPTIQVSNKIALDKGISLKKILEQVKAIRDEITIPVILMGYLNPIYQYGIEKFCMDCSKAGVSGVIVPDLPVKEYQELYKNLFEKNGLINVFLITPQTPPQRLHEIDRISKGFIYMVSSASTTGARAGLSRDQIQYFKRINAMKLKTPRLIGFGISDHGSFSEACRFASGAIIGSAFIRQLEQSEHLEKDIIDFVQSIKGNRS